MLRDNEFFMCLQTLPAVRPKCTCRSVYFTAIHPYEWGCPGANTGLTIESSLIALEVLRRHFINETY